MVLSKFLKLTFTIFFFTCFFDIHPQGFEQDRSIEKKINQTLPPPPEAAALGRYVDIPTGNYTGIPKISIPIDQIRDGSLTVPVSLSYHASGNKVEDIASNVGLGWALNAGGMVTRVVRGLPDDIWRGLSIDYAMESITYDEIITFDPSRASLYWEAASNGCRDLEPDLYYFNFNGNTGKFTFDWDGNIVVNESDQWKIIPVRDDFTIVGWEFTDKYGNEYLFEGDGFTYIESGYLACNIIASKRYIGAWHLKSITDVNDKGQITFHYDDTYEIDYDHQHTEVIKHSKAANDLNDCSGFYGGISTITTSEMEVSGSYLTSISNSSGHKTINFNYTTPRSDIDGANLNFLNEIEINYPTSSNSFSFDLVHEGYLLQSIQKVADEDIPPYEFNYNSMGLPARSSKDKDHWGYFNDNGANTLIPPYHRNDVNGYYYFDGGNRSPSEERMQAQILEGIVYPTGGKKEFIFEPHSYGFTQSEPVSEYESYRFSDQAAMAGTSSGTETNQDLSEFEVFPVQPDDLTKPMYVTVDVNISWYTDGTDDEYFGGNKHPLVKILNDAGESVFHSSSHGSNRHHIALLPGNYTLVAEATWWNPTDTNARDGASITVSFDVVDFDSPVTSKMAGGLRVKEIRDFEFQKTSDYRVTKFLYEMEDGRSSGVIYQEPSYVHDSVEQYHHVDNGSDRTLRVDVLCTYTLRYASNVSMLGSTQGSHIGYKRVKVLYGEGGEYGSKLYEFTSPEEYGDIIRNEPPFAPNTSFSFQTGLPMRVVDYNSDGFAIKEKINDYVFSMMTVPGFKVNYKGGDTESFLSKYDTSVYLNNFGHAQLSSSQIIHNQQDGGEVDTYSEFLYDGKEQNLLRHTKITSKDQVKVNNYRYPSTNSNEFIEELSPVELNGKATMLSEHMLGIVIEEDEFINSKELTRKRISYNVSNTIDDGESGLIIPREIKISSKGDPFYTAETFFYDAKGFVREIQSKNNPSRTIIRGYGQTLPVLEVLNADYLEVSQALGDDLEVLVNSNSDDQIRNIGNDLRQAMPQSQVKCYTYNPDIGVSSITDSNGITHYYYYDQFGRLKLLEDHENNLLKKLKYEYHSD